MIDTEALTNRLQIFANRFKAQFHGQLGPMARHLRDRARGKVRKLDEESIRKAYARWAPYYDAIFSAPFYFGRRAAVAQVNQLEGDVLEVGVGTGLSLPCYRNDLTITGIDLSEEMLARARHRAAKLPNVKALETMDAAHMTFPDNSFDVVVAMYVMSVVPDPARVMAELERVTKPGGTVLVVNHFSADGGMRSWLEEKLAPLCAHLGWNAEFAKSRVICATRMKLTARQSLAPMRLFTLLRFRKPETTQEAS